MSDLTNKVSGRNREIKFRVWDHNDEIFCHKKQNYGVVTISERGLVANEKPTSSLSGGGLNGRHCCVQTIYPFSPHEVTVQQFTGLKDKNGKEIYEGDIVHWRGDDVYNYIIKFKEYLDRERMPHLGFCLERCDYEFDSISIAERTVEIIGNIFENSELIT